MLALPAFSPSFFGWRAGRFGKTSFLAGVSGPSAPKLQRRLRLGYSAFAGEGAVKSTGSLPGAQSSDGRTDGSDDDLIGLAYVSEPVLFLDYF